MKPTYSSVETDVKHDKFQAAAETMRRLAEGLKFKNEFKKIKICRKW